MTTRFAFVEIVGKLQGYEIFEVIPLGFAWLTMRPMSLYESGESNGSVSLGDLFSAPEKILEKNELKLQDIAFLICRSGWPMSVGLPEEAALEQAFDYYDAVTKEGITKIDGVKRASARVHMPIAVLTMGYMLFR